MVQNQLDQTKIGWYLVLYNT